MNEITPSLDYFKGKPCTIVTHTTNAVFEKNLEAKALYTIGFVQDIDPTGLLLSHADGTKSFFFWSGIVSIHEEKIEVKEEESKKIEKEPLKLSESTTPYLDFSILEKLKLRK